MAEAEAEVVLVAYLGPEGSYTHQATLSAFPSHTTTQITPQPTIADVFAAVQSRAAHRGVVPFENSSNGSVVSTLDLFADAQGRYPDIEVCGEVYVEVRHCLVGHVAEPNTIPPSSSPSSQPALDNSAAQDNPPTTPLHHIFPNIKTLYSHPQAWGQCTTFLTTHLPHAERRDVSSTSRAAQLVAQDPSGTSAALASPTAAPLYRLTILAAPLNDRVGNTTRFLILARRRHTRPATDTPEAAVSQSRSQYDGGTAATAPLHRQRYKSLVTFMPDNDADPGALTACLAAFSRRGINLTSINTRPAPGATNWRYIFFVEFEGRLLEEGGGGVGGGGGGHYIP